MELNICQLYQDILNQYGDRGNIFTLKKRCEWRNINVNIYNVSVGDVFSSEQYDIVFFGGNQDYKNITIRHDLINNKGDAIRESIQNGKTFLCLYGGYQLLGKYVKPFDGEQIECLGALDIWTIEHNERMVGNTIFECNFLKSDNFDGKVIGFENHSGKTYLGNNVKPLGKIIKGNGNNGEDMSEGAIYNNVFCSCSQGSLLPSNPILADFIIQVALTKKYSSSESLKPLDDQFEMMARSIMLNRNTR